MDLLRSGFANLIRSNRSIECAVRSNEGFNVAAIDQFMQQAANDSLVADPDGIADLAHAMQYWLVVVA